jgi:Leucine-rich repeat (LRR) protein
MSQIHLSSSEILNKSGWRTLDSIDVTLSGFDVSNFGCNENALIVTLNRCNVYSFDTLSMIFPYVQKLELNQCTFKFDGLENMSHLIKLKLLNSDIGILPELESTTIRTLKITGCNLYCLGRFSGMPNLSKLDLSDNQLSDLPCTRTLKKLIMSGNYLDELRASHKFERPDYQSLEYLDVSDNSTLEQINLEQFKSLKTLIWGGENSAEEDVIIGVQKLTFDGRNIKREIEVNDYWASDEDEMVEAIDPDELKQEFRLPLAKLLSLHFDGFEK